MATKCRVAAVSILLSIIIFRCECLTLGERAERDAFRFPDENTPGLEKSSSAAALVSGDAPIPAATDAVTEELPVTSGQLLRLRGGRGPNIGYLELFSGRDWYFLCDEGESWGLSEGNVACRQLGYDQGVIHTTHGNSSLGSLEKITAGSHKSINMNLKCKGDERLLSRCAWRTSGLPCDMSKKVVSIVCSKPSYALCPGEQEPFGQSCYELHQDKLGFTEAQAACETKGGHLLELSDQAENNFISEWLDHMANSPVTVLTGGLVNSVAGKSFILWHHSKTPVTFSRFIQNISDAQPAAGSAKAVSLQKTNGYFYWIQIPLEEANSFICESPQQSVGCITETGANYNGTASRGEGGKVCLAWNTPGLQEIFPGQSSWSHNHCRNPDGLEESPICFISEEEYDDCAIPKCDDVKRRETVFLQQDGLCPVHVPSPVGGVDSPDSTHEACGKERFQCRPGECIFSASVCDGEPDCSEGEDEKDCVAYVGFFEVEQGFRLQSKDDAMSDATAEECAKKCMQAKHCTCTSFSHNPEKNRCLIGNRYSASSPYDAVVERKSWNYFKLNASVDFGCNRVKRPASTPFEGIRLLSKREADVVEVKINGTWGGICDDGFSFNEAHVVCRQLGFELGAEQVLNGQGTPNDVINVFDLECDGDEKHISECRFGDHDAHKHVCAGSEKAGLKCRKTSRTCEEYEWHCKDKECVHINNLCDGIPQCKDASDEDQTMCSAPLQVRLVDGESLDSGRVEVRHNGVWGTVCDDYFGPKEAQVVCTMLGIGNSIGRVYNGSTDFRGSGPVWIRLAADQVCKGTESSLEQCKSKDLWQHDHHCSHAEDVAITCSPKDNEQETPSAAAASAAAGVNSNIEMLPMHSDVDSASQKELVSAFDDVLVRRRALRGGQGGGGPVTGPGHSQNHRVTRVILPNTKIQTPSLQIQWIQNDWKFKPLPPSTPSKHKLSSSLLHTTEFAKLTQFDIFGYFSRSESGNTDAVASLLLGGATAKAGVHPWQATVRVRGMGKTYHWCGAVIISHYHLLTAAHCLREFPMSTYLVRVGDWVLDVNDSSEAEYEIDKINYHENYNVGPYLNNDLAVIRIKSPPDGPGILFGPKVSPVCLPPPDFFYGAHMNLTITGWGKVGYEGGEGDSKFSDNMGSVNQLQEAVIPVIPKSDCEDEKVYGTARLSSGMFCAGVLEGGGPDACQGDSGGPAVADVGGKKVLLGITSWGYGCGRKNKPGVYTKVANYVSWISRVTNESTNKKERR